MSDMVNFLDMCIRYTYQYLTNVNVQRLLIFYTKLCIEMFQAIQILFDVWHNYSIGIERRKKFPEENNVHRFQLNEEEKI